MPNHYTNILLVHPGEAMPDDLIASLKGWAHDVMCRLRPPPAIGAADWVREHWGVNRDLYDIKNPVLIPGDCLAVMLTFCSAWGPPHDGMRALMCRDIVENHGASCVVWIGMDPSDSSTTILTQWRP